VQAGLSLPVLYKPLSISIAVVSYLFLSLFYVFCFLFAMGAMGKMGLMGLMNSRRKLSFSLSSLGEGPGVGFQITPQLELNNIK
jgi:hypothetical protein